MTHSQHVIIAQLLFPGASEYEKKSQAIDFASFSGEHVVRIGNAEGADVVHVYGEGAIGELHLPYVSNARPKRRRFRKTNQPRYVITPIKETLETFIPEAVAETYFGNGIETGNRRVVGTYFRAELRNIVQQTAARIQRYRDDVDWMLFDTPPSPGDLRAVDLWIDPVAAEDDFDGFVAEALAAGVPVVASRTAINNQRLEKGRTGILVPPGDPNEWTHAILAALFKPEFRHTQQSAAAQTVSKFRPRHRAAALMQLYRSIVP
jgi:hypothetical protein